MRRQRRWLVGLAVVAGAALALWLALRLLLPAAEDPTWERIVETGVLPVCTDPSWPPFEYRGRANGPHRRL